MDTRFVTARSPTLPDRHHRRSPLDEGVGGPQVRGRLERAAEESETFWGGRTAGNAELGVRCRRAGPLTADCRSLGANQLPATTNTALPGERCLPQYVPLSVLAVCGLGGRGGMAGVLAHHLLAVGRCLTSY
jgi:hypothetical protein